MNGSTRRTFLRSAGVGAAAVGAAALTPVVVSTTEAQAPAPAGNAQPLPAGAAGSMVAYIHDIAKGEVSVMVEGREVMITDHQLVATLAHAVHASSL